MSNYRRTEFKTVKVPLEPSIYRHPWETNQEVRMPVDRTPLYYRMMQWISNCFQRNPASELEKVVKPQIKSELEN